MHRKLSVGVERLRVLCIIGILPEERLIPQPLLISLTTRVKDPDAFLDYSALANIAMQLAKESHFFLLEEYASALCHTILQNPLIDTLKVRIEKPSAIPSAHSAFIEMEASRCTGH